MTIQPDKRILFVHSVASLAGLFDTLAREEFGGRVDVLHCTDELLLRDVLEHQQVTPFSTARFLHHAQDGQAWGADAVLLTCSSLAPCVDTVRPQITIPVFRIDQAMAAKAVEMGKRIGILATTATTLKPTADMVRQCAARAGKTVDVETVLCDQRAYEAMRRGDSATHDRIVHDTLKKIAAGSDVVLLAQASMLRVVESLTPGEIPVPVLASPRLALQDISIVLGISSNHSKR